MFYAEEVRKLAKKLAKELKRQDIVLSDKKCIDIVSNMYGFKTGNCTRTQLVNSLEKKITLTSHELGYNCSQRI